MANNKLKLSMAAMLSLCAFTANADLIESVIKDGKLNFDARYRFEDVDQDTLDNTYANTIRTRLGWQSGEYMGVSGVLGFSNVTRLGGQKYNSGGGTSPDEVNHAQISDPNGTVVHEAYLNFNNFTNTNIKVGRQHVNVNNMRFIADAGFRQTQQTMDAVALTNTSFENLELMYLYADRLNTIFGEEATFPNAHQDLHGHVLNVKYDAFQFLTLLGYYLNFDNEDVNTSSSKTYGFAGYGSLALNPTWDVHYRAEYAKQKDAHNNPVGYSESYTHFMLGLTYDDMLTLKVGREDLGGDRNVANASFRTPYGNGHQYNGWADMFLATPNAGLEDTYVMLKADVDVYGPLTLKARYHDFEQSDGGADLGHEYDLGVYKTFCKNWGTSLVYADYDADGGMLDTQKFWFTVTYTL